MLGHKVRNWNVDDELNRDWMKLLLWLREAFEQETEGMTTKEGHFITKDKRVIFIGGPKGGEGGVTPVSKPTGFDIANLEVIPGSGGALGIVDGPYGVKIIADRDNNPQAAVEMINKTTAVLDLMHECDPEVVAGLKKIDFVGDGFPFGAMVYVQGENQIWLTSQGRDKDLASFTHSMVHELGHRKQLEVAPATFREFKQAGFGREFGRLAEAAGWGEFVRNYDRSRWDGEAFAESYAWFHLHPQELRAQFPEIYAFWEQH